MKMYLNIFEQKNNNIPNLKSKQWHIYSYPWELMSQSVGDWYVVCILQKTDKTYKLANTQRDKILVRNYV